MFTDPSRDQTPWPSWSQFAAWYLDQEGCVFTFVIGSECKNTLEELICNLCAM